MADTFPQIVVFDSTNVATVGIKGNANSWTAANTFTESVIITKAIGTAPLTITSTTKVSNLNVDMFDSPHSTDVPNIKQNVSLLAQTAAIGTTAITGTNTAGLYRVSYYLEDVTADVVAGTIQVTFAYSDDGGATTIPSIALPLTAVGRTQDTLYIRVLGTGSISFSTTLVGIIGTSQYGLFISAEKLL